jgi:hypothetical protein
MDLNTTYGTGRYLTLGTDLNPNFFLVVGGDYILAFLVCVLSIYGMFYLFL